MIKFRLMIVAATLFWVQPKPENTRLNKYNVMAVMEYSDSSKPINRKERRRLKRDNKI